MSNQRKKKTYRNQELFYIPPLKYQFGLFIRFNILRSYKNLKTLQALINALKQLHNLLPKQIKYDISSGGTSISNNTFQNRDDHIYLQKNEILIKERFDVILTYGFLLLKSHLLK